MSTGFVVVAKLGSTRSNPARVAADSGASESPADVAASAAMTQVAPELLTTARRLPSGRQPLR